MSSLSRTPSPTPSASSASTYFPTIEELIDECNNPSPISNFHPTAPRSESGSPKKDRFDPLDPACPQLGLEFKTLEAAIHCIKEYEHRRGYQWRKGESQKKDGILLYHIFLSLL